MDSDVVSVAAEIHGEAYEALSAHLDAFVEENDVALPELVILLGYFAAEVAAEVAAVITNNEFSTTNLRTLVSVTTDAYESITKHTPCANMKTH